MNKIVRSLYIMTCVVTVSGCSGVYENPATQYIQRTDPVTLGAGDAVAVNNINSVIDPWPPGVNDRRIPGDGERMVSAIGRYHAPATQRPSGQTGQAAPVGSSSASSAPDKSGTLPF